MLPSTLEKNILFQNPYSKSFLNENRNDVNVKSHVTGHVSSQRHKVYVNSSDSIYWGRRSGSPVRYGLGPDIHGERALFLFKWRHNTRGSSARAMSCPSYQDAAANISTYIWNGSYSIETPKRSKHAYTYTKNRYRSRSRCAFTDSIQLFLHYIFWFTAVAFGTPDGRLDHLQTPRG